MGDWKIIVPEVAVNLIDDEPSFETGTTGWTTGGSNTIAQSAAQQRFGAYSALCTYQSSLVLADHVITLTAVPHTFSTYAYIPSNYDGTQLRLQASNYASAIGELLVNFDMSLTDQWQRVDLTLTPDGGDLVGSLRISDSGAPTAGRFIYIDAVDVVAADHVTTHVDGDQDGCEWDGEPHASTSRRSTSWRGGGRVRDLKDYYGFAVTRATGVGATAIQLSRRPYATVPGSRLTGAQRPERVFTLRGNIIPNDSITTHSRRTELTKLLSPEAYPKHNGKWQPVRLRYEGAATIKEIAAHYEGGLEADWTVQEEYNFEEASIRFFCEDPFWYEIGESAQVLDTQNSATLSRVAAYLKDLGRWDTLNINNPPASFTVLTSINRMSNGKVWVCGKYQGWNGTAGMDMIAIFDPSTRQWEKAGPGTSFGETVWDAVEAANGTVYVVGEFNPGDGSSVTHVAKLVGNTWVTLGSPGTHSAVRRAVFAPSGDLYVVGGIDDFAGISGADGIARWDGSWYRVGNSHMGTGTVFTVAIDKEDHPYIGGSFENFAGTSGLHYKAWYNGTEWASFGGTAVNNWVLALEFDPNEFLYMAGRFTLPESYLMRYNGNSFEALGGAPGSAVQHLARGPDGIWYFTTISDRVAHRWDGTESSRLAVTFSTTISNAVSMDIGPPDPVLKNDYDLWFAPVGTGTLYFAGTAIATHDGSGKAYPYLKIKREGGSSAKLISLRNNTTGKEIAFDYDFQDGEELTVDLRPHRRNIVSSHRGQQWAAAKRGSSINPFHLQQGVNDILTYVEQSGGTVTANLIWRDTYDGFDG